jgi:hypothetical protein
MLSWMLPRWQTGISTSSCQVIGNLIWRWVNRLGTVVCMILGGDLHWARHG